MPVPDEFKIAPDFFQCPWCLKDYPDTELMHGFFRKNIADKTGRVYYICKNCFKRAQTDKKFDEEITAKVFKERLGRLIEVAKEKK